MLSHLVVPIHMFEFPHVFLTLVAAVAYLKARREPRARWRQFLVGLGALSYLLALTSKEMAFPLPLFLAALAWWGPDGIKRGVRREAWLLAPFVAVALLYTVLHIRQIPSRPPGDDYRIDFWAPQILQNMRKFPLFLVRVFQLTGDTKGQTGGLFSPINTLFGLAILALTRAQVAIPGGLGRRLETATHLVSRLDRRVHCDSDL